MATPRLSVIIPFYDETAFVDLAIKSVQSQRIPGCEVILVNDNPERFDTAFFDGLSLPSMVTVLHHTANRGLSAARNTGIRASRAARIAFLDADDYYLADGLAAQLSLAERSGADVTHANCCISQVGSPSLSILPRDKALFPEIKTGAGLRGVEHAQFITSSWSSIYRRDFLDGNALLFDEEQVKFEDRLFVLQTVTASHRLACLGKPVRVWRRRSGSISVSDPDLGIHRLQVQLLEKCMAHMRSYDQKDDVPPRFLRREVFNTLSRLIWDLDLVPRIARGDDPDYADLGRRIPALLGDDRFGQQIFDDPVLKLVSRVGMRTRKGFVKRVDFFNIHKALRDGDFDAASRILTECRPKIASPPVVSGRRGRHLVLHVGMHKTGSTFLQRGLLASRDKLRAAGILFPQTGLAGEEFFAVRPGGFPGHLGLLVAARNKRDEIWTSLNREIETSRAKTVILSCENMLAPITPDRDALLHELFRNLSGFESCQVIAFARRPDQWAEMFYRELVCNGQRRGARSLDEFLVDFGDTLTDLPALFAPFEAFSRRPVALCDHDALRLSGGHWSGFFRAASMSAVVPEPNLSRSDAAYRTPDRDQVLAARLLNTMLMSEEQRMLVLRAFFAVQDPGESSASLLSPKQRLALIDRFAEVSENWSAARGYRPDLNTLRNEVSAEEWTPPNEISVVTLERMLQARLQVELPADARVSTGTQFEVAERGSGGLTIRIQPRPWLTKVMGWMRR